MKNAVKWMLTASTASTINQVENCSLVDVDWEKSSGRRRRLFSWLIVWQKIIFYYTIGHEKCCWHRPLHFSWSTWTRLHFSTGQHQPDCTFLGRLQAALFITPLDLALWPINLVFGCEVITSPLYIINYFSYEKFQPVKTMFKSYMGQSYKVFKQKTNLQMHPNKFKQTFLAFNFGNMQFQI